VALERDALFCGRGGLSGGSRDADCERRNGSGEQTVHGIGQPTSTGLEPSTPFDGSPDTPSLEMTLDEGAGAYECATAGLQMSIPQMPRVDHMRPDFQGHRHIGGASRCRKTGGVLEQHLG
jgi:hypothetical protein